MRSRKQLRSARSCSRCARARAWARHWPIGVCASAAAIAAAIERAGVAPDQVRAKELAGEPITATLTTAPSNGAAIGGLKVCTESGWFAARPSGTEDVYKIYAESFRGPDHLARIQEEARAVVADALGSG